MLQRLRRSCTSMGCSTLYKGSICMASPIPQSFAKFTFSISMGSQARDSKEEFATTTASFFDPLRFCFSMTRLFVVVGLDCALCALLFLGAALEYCSETRIVLSVTR